MTQTLSVRMDSEVKKEFIAWCNEVGMNASVAVNIFAKKVLRDKKMPFELAYDNDDSYIKSIDGLEKSIIDASNEPIENYVEAKKLQW